MSRVADYLRIPCTYADTLGGLRWAPDGDAVETQPTGAEEPRTFVITPALVRLIEGFAAGDELPSIAFLLHFMHLLGASMHGVRPVSPQARRLDEAFRATGRIMRNAGSFCAALCAVLPRAAEPPSPPDVVTVLCKPRWNQWLSSGRSLTYDLAEVPPLSPDEFETRVLRRVAGTSDQQLRHWFRHGRAPIGGAGESIARLTPPALLEALRDVERRPRLSGTGALVANLSGALSLPPRRRAQSELPSGGYSDLATRGVPEQILPIQFALDELEFLRRFAEHELLYFHRETPQSPTAEQVLLVVDQGVRTWGDVRLVLAAGALALGRQAVRRGRALLVSTTGLRGRILDAAESDAEALGVALEASDLSPDPGEALERVLTHPADGPRDVVLLTHPRALQAENVIAAAKRAAKGMRLFAVAVDAEGRVALSELRGGAPVLLAGCRVVVNRSTAAGPAPAPLTRAAAGWEGCAEPVAYPFRLGALQRFRDDMFVFDEQGEWILLSCAPGLLHLWKADGSAAELLPRAWVDGAPLHRVEVVMGVAGGFAVVGTIGRDVILAHYDLGRRTVAAHRLGFNHGPERIWWYDRRHHAVVGCTKTSRYVLYAVDLAAPIDEACYRRWLPEANVAPRARAAANAAPPEDALRPLVLRLHDTLPESGRIICLDPTEGVLSARRDDGRWRHFPFDDDGRPALRGATVVDARWRGQTLGLLVSLATPAGQRRLLIFHEELERVVAAVPVDAGVESFALAPDGLRFALRVNKRQLAIHEIGRHSSLFITPISKSHSRTDVELGHSVLVVRTSKFTHLFRWDRGPLQLLVSQQPARQFLEEEFGGNPPPLSYSRVLGSAQVVRDERFDNKRFVSAVWSAGLGALVDCAGHVVVVDTDGDVVCIFHVYRHQVAAWMPDGTRIGLMPFIGGAPTLDAMARMAAALRAAAARGRGVKA